MIFNTAENKLMMEWDNSEKVCFFKNFPYFCGFSQFLSDIILEIIQVIWFTLWCSLWIKSQQKKFFQWQQTQWEFCHQTYEREAEPCICFVSGFWEKPELGMRYFIHWWTIRAFMVVLEEQQNLERNISSKELFLSDRRSERKLLLHSSSTQFLIMSCHARDHFQSLNGSDLIEQLWYSYTLKCLHLVIIHPWI